MTWYERRALLLAAAGDEPGWGCVRCVDDRHIGRVVMTRSYATAPGFYPLDSATYARLDHATLQRQRAITRNLPK